MTFRALRKCVNMGTTIMPMPPPNPALLTPVSHAPKQRIMISVIVRPPFRWHKYSELLINCQAVVRGNSFQFPVTSYQLRVPRSESLVHLFNWQLATGH